MSADVIEDIQNQWLYEALSFRLSIPLSQQKFKFVLMSYINVMYFKSQMYICIKDFSISVAH